MAQRGFSLIELIAVMMIVSIIGLTAFPRLNDTQGFAYAAQQERLISTLRLIQNKAMQDTRPAICYQINFRLPDVSGSVVPAYGFATRNYALSNAAQTCDENAIDFTVYPEIITQPNELDSADMTLITADGAALGYRSLGFDSLGRPQNTANNCTNTCKISFDIASVYGVCINREGMIYAC